MNKPVSAKLVSINIGTPRDVQWHGKTVRTAIWKQAVQGRVMANRLNLAGDGQADLAAHGGEHRAVMVYQLDSYRYWEKFLQRSDFTMGQFGENLTVEGLADNEVCIGDRFQIGGAVFEVTQPRVTCYRVGIRMDHPEMPALLVSHHRPGFYFRVIEEGEIGAGDQIVKIAGGAESMSVAQIDALLYTADRPAEALRLATQIPALSPGWRNSFEELLAAGAKQLAAGSADLPPAPASLFWDGFRPFKVLAVRQESADVRSFVLAAEDGSALPDALPGQHIAVKVPAGSDASALSQLPPSSPPFIRMYSLSGPSGTNTYRISVKRELRPGGSAALHAHTHPGDILEISAPRGTFVLAATPRPAVFLSAGIGVTPVLAMLYASVAADPNASRKIWWLHCARDGAHHSFAMEARRLVQSLKSGHMKVIYSHPGADDIPGVNYDVEGHLDPTLFRQWGIPDEADFYLCGPAAFLDAMASGLAANGVAESRIYEEVFGPVMLPAAMGTGSEIGAPHLPDGPPGTGPMISFVRSGLAVPWDDKFKNLLEFAEACSVQVKWSCRTGVCHYCECSLIEGKLRYRPDPLEAPAKGNALICCSTPLSEIQLDL
ncbi:MAG TPA: MOSC and FAD-binding oxidoreductase domain-containing protein [Herbaspirillum sp.]